MMLHQVKTKTTKNGETHRTSDPCKKKKKILLFVTCDHLQYIDNRYWHRGETNKVDSHHSCFIYRQTVEVFMAHVPKTHTYCNFDRKGLNKLLAYTPRSEGFRSNQRSLLLDCFIHCSLQIMSTTKCHPPACKHASNLHWLTILQCTFRSAV